MHLRHSSVLYQGCDVVGPDPCTRHHLHGVCMSHHGPEDMATLPGRVRTPGTKYANTPYILQHSQTRHAVLLGYRIKGPGEDDGHPYRHQLGEAVRVDLAGGGEHPRHHGLHSQAETQLGIVEHLGPFLVGVDKVPGPGPE